MIWEFVVGWLIGWVIGSIIAELIIYIDGLMTINKIREEAKRQAELNAVKKFLVTEVKYYDEGPEIVLAGADNSDTVVAKVTVKGNSKDSELYRGKVFYK